MANRIAQGQCLIKAIRNKNEYRKQSHIRDSTTNQEQYTFIKLAFKILVKKLTCKKKKNENMLSNYAQNYSYPVLLNHRKGTYGSYTVLFSIKFAVY